MLRLGPNTSPPQDIHSLTLFIPGGSSYIQETFLPRDEYDPNGGYNNLSFTYRLAERSDQRAQAAADIFRSGFHTSAVFSAGYPGTAARWITSAGESLAPAPGKGEATKMAEPLQYALLQGSRRGKPMIADRCGHSEQEVNKIVRVYDQSKDTFGDVIGALENDCFDLGQLRDDPHHGIQILAGRQAVRVGAILEAATGVAPNRIFGTRIRDQLNRRGGGRYGPLPERSRAFYNAREIAGATLTKIALREAKVQPGDIKSLYEAQELFAQMATGGLHTVVWHRKQEAL